MKQEYKKYGTGILILCLTVLSLLYIGTNKNEEYEFVSSDIIEQSGGDEELILEEPILEQPIIKKVPVYVCGEVKNPEVYYLDETAIVKEAIIAAGGFTDNSNKEAWNLAMQVQSGLKIDVPKMGEQIDKIEISYDNRVRENKSPNTADQLININIASAGELSTLPGIGPAIAQNIIEYREANGQFESLDDVTNVTRIGQITLEKIKDRICFQ